MVICDLWRTFILLCSAACSPQLPSSGVKCDITKLQSCRCWGKSITVYRGERGEDVDLKPCSQVRRGFGMAFHLIGAPGFIVRVTNEMQ